MGNMFGHGFESHQLHLILLNPWLLLTRGFYFLAYRYFNPLIPTCILPDFSPSMILSKLITFPLIPTILAMG